MAFNPPKGAGKGPGNNASHRPLDTSPEKQRERSQKGKLIQAKMRAWREAHPEWQPAPEMVSRKQIRDYILSKVPDAIDKAETIAHDDHHPKQAEAIKLLVEHGIGRPPQDIEAKVTGAMSIVFSQDDTGVL